MNVQKLMKVSTSISFLLITYALLSIAKNPTKGYELSIYSATPIIFWIAVLIGILNGIFLLLFCAHRTNNTIFKIGIFEIIYCNCLLVSIYALRNYVLIMGRGDNATYVSFTKDIIIYGNVLDYNIYPHTSILIAQIHQISGIPIELISQYITPLFWIIYTLSIYCWSKSIFTNQKFVIFSVIASSPLFFAWFSATIYYMLLSTLMLPLLFYCIQKNKDVRFRILTLVLCLILPFSHPITTVFVFIYFITIYIVNKYTLYTTTTTEIKEKVSLSLVAFLFVAFATWFLSSFYLTKDISSIILQIVGVFDTETTMSQAQYYVNELGYGTAIKSFVMLVLDELIYLLMSLLAIYTIFKNKSEKMYCISSCLVIGNLFLFILFLFSKSHTPDRLINLNLNMIFTPILVGYVLAKSRDNYKVIFVSLIIFSVVMSMVSLYQSPITTRPNDQFTVSEMDGFNWFINTKSLNIPTSNLMSPPVRYADLLYGHKYAGGVRKDLDKNEPLPNNFGLIDNSTVVIPSDRYVIVTEYDMKAYTNVWEKMNRFNSKDFINIHSATNVKKIYDNNEVRIFLFFKED